MDLTLMNEYSLTNATGAATKVMAEKMADAVSIYADQLSEDPVTARLVGTGVRVAQLVGYTTFKTVVYSADGLAESAGCRATPGTYTVKGGTEVIFEAIPATGYKFQKWEIDGTDVTGGTEPVMKIVIPKKETVVTVKADFVTNIGG